MVRRPQERRTLSVTSIVLGLILGAIMIAPAFAHHNPAHTKRQVQQVKKQLRKLQKEHFAFYINGDGARRIAGQDGLSLWAICDIETTPTVDTATFEMRTSKNNASMDDNNGDEFSDFDIVDSPAELFSEDSDDAPNIEATNNGAGANGVSRRGVAVGLHDYALGVNLNGKIGTCFFTGEYYIRTA